jgi:diguanylate cyclase (GGDEF)-like protein
VVDNARLRQAERYEASHDPLTGLLNRRAFSHQMDTALETAAAANGFVTVLVIDLDRFKQVNDQLGHQYGDELLTKLAGRLRAALDDGDLLARMGGDEFAVALLSGRKERTEEVAADLCASLRRPVLLRSTPVQVTASIGMATFPGDGADLTGLLRTADLSMYAAKRAARPSGGHSPAPARDRDAHLLDDLRTALDRDDQLVLYFQPKVDLPSGEVTSVEALVRWRHPDLGLLGADRIVAPLEAAGLVTELSDWVVPRALDQLRRWDANGLELSMSVNVSADDLADDLAARVARWLGQAGIPGHRLVTELTEGALLPEESRTLSVLKGLRALGVETSIDDFGTGYSSLAYLATLPVDELKVDRSLLRDDPRHRRILRGIIGVGHELGARIVAEGVETVEDLRWLRAAGCDQAQGFLLGRPAPAATLIDVLRAEPGAARTPRSRASRP